VAALCQRCRGAQQARLIQTANLLVALGLEGSAPGARCLQASGTPARACVELPAEHGVLKLIDRLALLCSQNASESAGRLQKLVDSGDSGCDASTELLVGSMVACTQFVADACTALVISPEEYGVAQCHSLRGVMPLFDSCFSTLDAALALGSVARRMQVLVPTLSMLSFPFPFSLRGQLLAEILLFISSCPAPGNRRGRGFCGALAADVSDRDAVRAGAVRLAGG
jgi:hypothetical protein